MSTGDNSLHHERGPAENALAPNTPTEPSALEKKLTELRSQRILSGGDGPRETLRPVVHVPGALERFLKARA